MFICDKPAKAFIQVIKTHNGYNGCPRIDNRMTFPGVDCASRTAGNNSTVTEEPIVLPDLLIMSGELFIAFDKDCSNVNFLSKW
jgi:hypothetical protein